MELELPMLGQETGMDWEHWEGWGGDRDKLGGSLGYTGWHWEVSVSYWDELGSPWEATGPYWEALGGEWKGLGSCG